MFFLVLALFLLVCGGLVVLTTQNLSTSVHLVFYSWQTPAIPVALWIVGAFLLGTLLLYLISVASAVDDRREIAALQKHISELEAEKARSLSLEPAKVPISPLASGSPQISARPTKVPTSPLTLGSAQIPAKPIKPSTGPLQLSSPFMPMPGIYASPQNNGVSALPAPDSYQ